MVAILRLQLCGSATYKGEHARDLVVVVFGYFGATVFALIAFIVSYRLNRAARAFVALVWAVSTVLAVTGAV